MNRILKDMFERHPAAAAAVLLAAGLVLGYLLWGGGPAPEDAHKEHTKEASKSTVWTCSMHPQVRQPKPGKCPFCGMDLIPAGEGSGGEKAAAELKLSPRAEKLAEIEVTPVERKFVTNEIRMAGKVEFDETRLAYITAWIGGRIDRLYVDYTGVPVKKDDHLVSLYSPELLTAQEELIQAKKALDELKGTSSKLLRESVAGMLEAAREKFRLWGLTKKQIAEIERRGTSSDHMTIYSPIGGIVIEKHAREGMYVKTGMRIYTIADLSQVWVKLDAYESDLLWLRYGQPVGFSTEAYPGEEFKGTIVFIDPVLDERTRTVKVRVNVDNTAGKLKPGMFVRAIARVTVAGGGKVMDPALSGKWICPMHPEVVKEKAGECDVCGMPLVTTESLGYVPLDAKEADAPLVIPATAPLITGKRAVVYVSVPGKAGTYEGREVVLGPRAADHYIVKSGLEEGEKVVTNGAFKIDSALQIMAKPSMMSPESKAAAGKGKPQTTCPVMGGKINRKVFIDYQGKRIYFCCPGCDKPFRKDPEKYLRKLQDAGVVLEDTPKEATDNER